MLTGNQIRQKYLDFFKDKGHSIIPSASLIPENDPTLLFVNSGMFPLVPYLLGEKHPQGVRLADSQKSFRTEDIEEVGDGRHNTFFEMLGNWSLGDYFKEEQLTWIWEFLTKELKLAPQRLYTSVYRGNEKLDIPKDSESVKIWQSLFESAGIKATDIDLAEVNGMQGGRIFYYPDKENWWSRAGVPDNMPVGEPGGPDSEIYYDFGADLQRHENSEWKDKPCHPACDCGRFLEIGNNVFMEYIKKESGFEKLPQKNVDFGGGLERLTTVAQGKNNVFQTDLFMPIINQIAEISGKTYEENKKAFEIIADHLKSATMILSEDAQVTPSNTDQGYIIRRLIRRAVRYSKQLGVNKNFSAQIAEIVIDIYKEAYPIVEKNKNFIIEQLNQEEKKFAQTLERGLKELEEIFIPVARKKTSNVEFKDIYEEVVDRLYKGAAFNLFQSYGFPLEMTVEEAKKRKIPIDEKKLKNEFNNSLKKHQELSRKGAEQKFKGGLADSQEETAKLHTATHLLLAALKKVLGPQIEQKGSNITAERLRFDFNYDQKLTSEQLQEVEKIVNQQIEKKIPIICEEMPIEAAKKSGATGVFGDKYGEIVKVYKINDFSMELCGGPHAKNTGDLGKFKIKKEESSSAGIRRIKAVLE